MFADDQLGQGHLLRRIQSYHDQVWIDGDCFTVLRQDFFHALLDQLIGECLVTDQTRLTAGKLGQTFELGIEPGETLSLRRGCRTIACRDDGLHFPPQPPEIEQHALT
ncbi:hypothetical protein D3C76_1417740 [compost metagenome]